MTKQNIKRAGLQAIKGAAFMVGLVSEILYRGGERVYSGAASLYLWSELKLTPVKRPSTKIPVKQLGLATGQHINVRRPGPARKINVRYIESE